MPQSEELYALDRYELISLDLIDEPEIAQRETMDEAELAELALSVMDVGIVEPLIVRMTGERFQVIAGHRRLLASQIAHRSPVPCIVKADCQIDPLAILVAENAHREDPNPIEEARFYQRVLVELCGNDVDVLCAKVRRNRGFVEDRLLLLQGWPSVVDALQQKRISLAVAKELNKTKQPNALMLLLDTAIRQGATARQVHDWRREYDGQEDLQVIPVDANGAAANGVVNVPFSEPPCYFCGDSEDSHLMVTVRMHKPCKKMVDQALGRVEGISLQQAN